MKKLFIPVLIVASAIGFHSGFGQVSYKKLDNPNASPEAVALYNHLT